MSYLLTTNDIADILGIEEAHVTFDIVDWAEREVERIVGKTYSEEEVEDPFYFTERQSYIDLSYPGVTEIVSVEISEDKGVTWDDIPVDEYHLYNEEGMIRFDYLLQSFTDYKVTYKHGDAQATDLERKLHFLIVFRYMITHSSQLFTPNGTIESKKLGDYTIKYSVEKVKSQPEMLDNEIESLTQLIGGGSGYYAGLM